MAGLFDFLLFKGSVALGLVYDTMPRLAAEWHRGMVGKGLDVPFLKGVECWGTPVCPGGGDSGGGAGSAQSQLSLTL